VLAGLGQVNGLLRHSFGLIGLLDWRGFNRCLEDGCLLGFVELLLLLELGLGFEPKMFETQGHRFSASLMSSY